MEPDDEMDAPVIADWKDSRCIQILGGSAPNYRWSCVACRRSFTGGSRKFFNHILGVTDDKSAQCKPCAAVIPPEVVAFCEQKISSARMKKRARIVADEEARHIVQAEEAEQRDARRADHLSLGGSIDTSSTNRSSRQVDIQASLATAEKAVVDAAVASMIYETGLPMSWAKAPAVREMFNALCVYGKKTGREQYVPPGVCY